MEQISKRLMNWASILEDATRDQAVTASEMPFIFPHLALMPDAHLGKGATVGSVIPTLRAHHPSGGRRRHRLRHDRGPHPVLRQRPPDGPPQRAPSGDRGRDPTVGRQVQQGRRPGPHEPTDRGAGGSCGECRLRPGAATPATGGCSSAPSAPATTSSRCPLTRTTRFGCSSTRVPRRREPDRQAPHQGRPAAVRPVVDHLPDRDLAYLVEGTDGVRGLHRASFAGRSASRCRTGLR